MRLFIGILPSRPAMIQLSYSIEALKKVSQGNFVDASNLHLTLQFLGEKNISDIHRIEQAMQDAAKGTGKIQLALEEPGKFDRGDESIVWYGLTGEIARLNQLAINLAACLEKQVVIIEKNNFKPHITLARRVKPEAPWPEVFEKIKMKPEGFTAAEMVLFESTRVSGRLTYTPIHREIL